MPRYVILEHDWPQRHWDFMLEAGGVLRTWRLATPPQLGASVPAAASFDHRLHYLDYEGPVSGQRGVVTRWDAGTCTWLADEPGRVVVQLHGTRLRATVMLLRGTEEEWACLFGPPGELEGEGRG